MSRKGASSRSSKAVEGGGGKRQGGKSEIRSTLDSGVNSEKRKVVGSYMLGKTIGEGTFGKVKIAVHMPTGEKVAVKILEKSKIKEQADVRRVNREIKILKKSVHRNIIQLYEVLDTQNSIYLMMENCEGGEMFDYIVSTRYVAEPQACKFFHQILDGVSMLHKNDVTHRDLKPENLLLKSSKDGWIVKIVDFGLSNTHEGNRLLSTACGSPCYAAPEMIAGKKYEGPKADMWSMGVILFALVCGFLPFEDPNTSLLYKKILSGDYKPAKWISDEVRDLIRKILETDPDKRYTSDDIRNHSWYQKVNENEIPMDLLPPEEMEKIRREVMQQVVDTGEDMNGLVDALRSKTCNSLTATYYLLEQKAKLSFKKREEDSAKGHEANVAALKKAKIEEARQAQLMKEEEEIRLRKEKEAEEDRQEMAEMEAQRNRLKAKQYGLKKVPDKNVNTNTGVSSKNQQAGQFKKEQQDLLSIQHQQREEQKQIQEAERVKLIQEMNMQKKAAGEKKSQQEILLKIQQESRQEQRRQQQLQRQAQRDAQQKRLQALKSGKPDMPPYLQKKHPPKVDSATTDRQELSNIGNEGSANTTKNKNADSSVQQNVQEHSKNSAENSELPSLDAYSQNVGQIPILNMAAVISENTTTLVSQSARIVGGENQVQSHGGRNIQQLKSVNQNGKEQVGPQSARNALPQDAPFNFSSFNGGLMNSTDEAIPASAPPTELGLPTKIVNLSAGQAPAVSGSQGESMNGSDASGTAIERPNTRRSRSRGSSSSQSGNDHENTQSAVGGLDLNIEQLKTSSPKNIMDKNSKNVATMQNGGEPVPAVEPVPVEVMTAKNNTNQLPSHNVDNTAAPGNPLLLQSTAPNAPQRSTQGQGGRSGKHIVGAEVTS